MIKVSFVKKMLFDDDKNIIESENVPKHMWLLLPLNKSIIVCHIVSISINCQFRLNTIANSLYIIINYMQYLLFIASRYGVKIFENYNSSSTWAI